MTKKRRKQRDRKGKPYGTYLPRQGGKLIATPGNDISIPFYTDVLEPQDPTLKARGTVKGLRLYDEVKKDGRCQTVLNKRASKVTRREWIIEAASDDPADQKTADGVKAILKALPFDQICKRLLSSILKGFAVGEIVWHRNDDGLIAPSRIKDQDPARFRFDKDWKPRLLTRENTIDGIELPERKFIIHRFQAEGDNPYGLGLGSVLFWHVLFKRQGSAFWLVHLEKFASPTPFGRFPAGTPKPEQDALLVLLRNLVQNGALVAPVGTELDLLEAKRSGEAGHEAWNRYWDEQSSEVVLGSTLSTNVKGQGSRAASETHAEETEAIVDDDADDLSATLNDTLIRWICELNWPDATPPTIWRPRPKNVTAEEEQKRKRHERQSAGIRALNAARREGYEPKDVQIWLGDVMETEMVPVKRPVEADADNPSFAAPDGPVDHLIEQLVDLAAEPTEQWIDQIRGRLSGATTYSEASKILLDTYPDLQIDPMGNILGDAIALADLIGRSDIIDQTGIYPTGAKALKKKT